MDGGPLCLLLKFQTDMPLGLSVTREGCGEDAMGASP